jgi:cell division septal protein FtsQ
MKTSRKLSLGFGGLLLMGGLLVAGANFWKSNLTVGRVLVQGNQVVQTNEILQLAHIAEGSLMYDLDLMKVQRDVISHYFLKQVVVERDLPSTIRITVTERSPVAMINRGGMRYLDPDGVVLPHSASQELIDLPLISGLPADVPATVGATLDHPDIREALAILRAAPMVNRDLFHLISEIRVRNGGDLVLYTADGGIPVIYGRGEPAAKLVRLETVWNEFVSERGAREIDYIDIRFEDQVIVRWKQSTQTSKPSRS